MRKGNKKIWVILIMAVFMVISISIFAALYLHNDTKSVKNIKEFSDYVTDYKKEFEEYVLDKNEKDYNDLMEKCQKVIDNQDEDQVYTMISLLELFQEKVSSENRESLNEIIERIEFADLEFLSEEFKNDISKSILEAKELIDSKKYSSADSKLNELLKLINSEIYNTIESSDGKVEFVDSVSAEELILKEDSEFINNLFEEGAFLTFVCSYDHGIEAYGINEKVFVFNVINSKIETNDYVQAQYYVGSKTRNVYRYNELGGAGGNIYIVKNNKIKETIKYIHQEFNENLMDISLYEARVILDNAYPDYSFIDGGEISEVFNTSRGIEENAYCFRYKKNGTNDVYVGFVFSDKSFSFKFAGSL